MTNCARYIVDIMTPNPVVIGASASAWSAECLAEERGIHHLIVMEHYELVGEVCRCDLRGAKVAATVESCMHTPPITVEDQQTATDAVGIMSQRGVGCLPVIDWMGALHGVVTRRDLRKAGVLPPTFLRACASCGSTHGLDLCPGDGAVSFCRKCMEHTRAPLTSVDEMYFTSGGGD